MCPVQDQAPLQQSGANHATSSLLTIMIDEPHLAAHLLVTALAGPPYHPRVGGERSSVRHFCC